MNHFAVLNGFRGNYAHISDPARGMTKVPQKEFNSAFTGVVLLLHPSENLIPGGKRGSTVAFGKSGWWAPARQIHDHQADLRSVSALERQKH